MKLYEAIASTLIPEGVDKIFGVMGDANMWIWAAIARNNASQIYHARNEAGAVAMADGYFRASGKLGVATVTCGPGLTQCGTSLVSAARNRSPLLIITGEVPASERHHNQIMDQRRFVEACEARYVDVRSLDTAAETVADAFRMSRSMPGPVVLNIPLDLQNAELTWGWDYISSLEGMETDPETASDEALGRVVALVRDSHRPVIVAGHGAKRGNAGQALIELGDRIGALLSTSLQAKGFFSGQEYDVGISGSFASAAGEELLQDADLVIAVGAELGYYTSEGGLLFPEARVVRIDVEKPSALVVPKGIHVQGDAARTVCRLNRMLDDAQVRSAGFRTPETREVLDRPAQVYPAASDGIDPRALMRTLSGCLPRESLVIVGMGHFTSFVGMHLPTAPETDCLFSLRFGAIGQTLPLAFGAGMAEAKKPLVVIEGDGSIFMNIQELDAMARYGRQTLLIVWNDSGFGAEVHKLRAKDFDTSIASWTPPDFVTIAKGFGGDGMVVERLDEFSAAVNTGLERGGLFVIDVRVSPSAVSDPYSKVQFGVPNTAPHLRYTAG